MRKLFYLGATLAGFAGFALAAEETVPKSRPSVTALRVEQPPVIDGVLDAQIDAQGMEAEAEAPEPDDDQQGQDDQDEGNSPKCDASRGALIFTEWRRHAEGRFLAQGKAGR